MCQPDTDVTVSAIYKCHRRGSWGRATGGRGAFVQRSDPLVASLEPGRNRASPIDRCSLLASRRAPPTVLRSL